MSVNLKRHAAKDATPHHTGSLAAPAGSTIHRATYRELDEANAILCAENAAISADAYELKRWLNNAERILMRLGYQRCDAPACNCSSYHRSSPNPTPPHLEQ